MRTSQTDPFCFLVLMVAALLLLGAAGCGNAGNQAQAGFGAVDDVFRALSRAADDAARLAKGRGNTSQLNDVSSKIDDLLRRAPENVALSPDERAVLRRAAQQAAIAREIATALGLTDEVKGFISKEAVELVKGFRYSSANRLSPALQRHLEEAGISILRDTTCKAFLAAMPQRAASLPSPTAQATPPSYRRATSPSFTSVYRSLETKIKAADSGLSEVTRYVNLSGLTSGVLSKSAGYVGKIKNSMTAATWENAGAMRAYLRLCVFSR